MCQPGHVGLVPEAVHFPVNPRMQTNRITNNSLACEPNSKDSPSTYHQDMCQDLPACVRHKPVTWHLLSRKMTLMLQALFQGDWEKAHRNLIIMQNRKQGLRKHGSLLTNIATATLKIKDSCLAEIDELPRRGGCCCLRKLSQSFRV